MFNVSCHVVVVVVHVSTTKSVDLGARKDASLFDYGVFEYAFRHYCYSEEEPQVPGPVTLTLYLLGCLDGMPPERKGRPSTRYPWKVGRCSEVVIGDP